MPARLQASAGRQQPNPWGLHACGRVDIIDTSQSAPGWQRARGVPGSAYLRQVAGGRACPAPLLSSVARRRRRPRQAHGHDAPRWVRRARSPRAWPPHPPHGRTRRMSGWWRGACRRGLHSAGSRGGPLWRWSGGDGSGWHEATAPAIPHADTRKKNSVC